ncbi:MAG TPA: hypothetical protein PLD03_01915 [Thiomonas arsenitoxydans]|nr:hypothetical protein [Thiomonas arsenitoxydans]
MTPQELRAHKIADKNLREAPRFEKCKKGKLPKPFKAMGGLRMHTTGLLKVSNTHSAIFFWRDGEILTILHSSGI